MDLKAHYNSLYDQSITLFKTNKYQVDNLINSPNDHRRGITLVIKPDEKIGEEFQLFLNELKEIDPNQYYYPLNDYHITALSIITCYDGFELSDIVVEHYIATIQKALRNIGPFTIEFEGLTASSSCIMACGYFKDHKLSQMRDQLRTTFNTTQLQKTIDQRYTIQTAHTTLVRLQENLKNSRAFITKVEENRNRSFGVFNVNSVELVYNDWYQKAEHVRVLHRFDL